MKEYIARFSKEGSRNHSVMNTEIIRCKDCFWYSESGLGCMHHKGLVVADEESYCPYGVRGDENNTK